MQKGFGVIYILVGILVVTLIAGGAFYLGGQTTPKPVVTSSSQPSISPDVSPAPTDAGETTNWKTYTNTKYGFSFKYPNSENWKFISLPTPVTNEDNTFVAECNNRCYDKENITAFQVSLSYYKSLNEYLSEAIL